MCACVCVFVCVCVFLQIPICLPLLLDCHCIVRDWFSACACFFLSRHFHTGDYKKMSESFPVDPSRTTLIDTGSQTSDCTSGPGAAARSIYRDEGGSHAVMLLTWCSSIQPSFAWLWCEVNSFQLMLNHLYKRVIFILFVSRCNGRKYDRQARKHYS